MQSYISAQDLHARLSSPDLRVVDVRSVLDAEESGVDLWAAGHVPGAVHSDWIRNWGVTVNGLKGMLPPADEFHRVLAELGIGSETFVVAYDDTTLLTASRFAWALLVNGHTNVAILDGGYPAWVDAGYRVGHGSAPSRPAQTSPQSGSPDIYADLTKVRDCVASAEWTIVDCRWEAAARGSGKTIPRAKMLSSSEFLQPDGHFKPADEIATIAHSAGLDPAGPTLLYCGRGVSAAAVFMALRSVGFSQLSVYDASFEEWSRDPSNPVSPYPGAEGVAAQSPEETQ
jgi:thiosulfate/3-mercaptopyruvate sulfurtransferase